MFVFLFSGCPGAKHPLQLRRADAVETAGTIRPLAIAKITTAVGECIGSNWMPDRIGQTRAGFHHHDPAAGPIDVEAKLIRAHPETGVAGLDPRPPGRRGPAAK